MSGHGHGVCGGVIYLFQNGTPAEYDAEAYLYVWPTTEGAENERTTAHTTSVL